jgi:hypothetical protein
VGGIAHHSPGYLGYVTSFLTIGGIWLAHYGIFRRLQSANNTVMPLNLLLLMAVSFLPFPIRLMAEAIRNTDAEGAAVIFYGGSLLVIALLVAALWRSVARRREPPHVRGQRGGDQRDRARDVADDRLLRRRYRARDRGATCGRVRLSADRTGPRAASARRRGTDSNRGRVCIGRGLMAQTSRIGQEPGHD